MNNSSIFFDLLKQYNLKWQVKESRKFNAEECAMVKEAKVVPSLYGHSIQFTMIGGYVTYTPLSQESTREVGEIVNIEDMKLLTLSKPGEEDIFRIMI